MSSSLKACQIYKVTAYTLLFLVSSEFVRVQAAQRGIGLQRLTFSSKFYMEILSWYKSQPFISHREVRTGSLRQYRNIPGGTDETMMVS